MASVDGEIGLSPYRQLLADLSFSLSSREVETLNLFIASGTTEKLRNGLQYFDILEQHGRIGPRNLALLQDVLETIGRVDLAQKIEAFLTASVNDKNFGRWRKQFIYFHCIAMHELFDMVCI